MFSHIGMLKTQQLTVVVWAAQSVCVCVYNCKQIIIIVCRHVFTEYFCDFATSLQ